jgi:hypothetical protein
LEKTRSIGSVDNTDENDNPGTERKASAIKRKLLLPLLDDFDKPVFMKKPSSDFHGHVTKEGVNLFAKCGY